MSSDDLTNKINSKNPDVERLEDQFNKIPTEIIDRFPEYKKLMDIVKDLIAQDVNPKEIEKYILTTKEFQDLAKRQVEIQEYQDKLEGYDRRKEEEDNIKINEFFQIIDKHANDCHFNNLSSNIGPTDEHKKWAIDILKSCGYRISYEELVKELATVGEISQIGHALNFRDFLSCLNDTAILRSDVRELEKMLENKEKIESFFRDFEMKYKV